MGNYFLLLLLSQQTKSLLLRSLFVPCPIETDARNILPLPPRRIDGNWEEKNPLFATSLVILSPTKKDTCSDFQISRNFKWLIKGLKTSNQTQL